MFIKKKVEKYIQSQRPTSKFEEDVRIGIKDR